MSNSNTKYLKIIPKNKSSKKFNSFSYHSCGFLKNTFIFFSSVLSFHLFNKLEGIL